MHNRLVCAIASVMVIGALSFSFADTVQKVKKPLDAVAELGKKCDSGDAGACLSLGNMYEHGDGVREDKHEAVALYTQACRLGESHGCGNMGITYDMP